MHSSERKLCYRPDLDGLRAIAILSVVFFHFDFATFGGGFVGVDIFFVISGYLITSIIVSELKLGSFSFARFYERRIRRIVPVLIVVLAVASIAALALFPPNELAQLGLSAAAAAAFCSNIFFAFQTNYFAGPDTMMPLLHTWSLGVEGAVLHRLAAAFIHMLPRRFAAGGKRACCWPCGCEFFLL